MGGVVEMREVGRSGKSGSGRGFQFQPFMLVRQGEQAEEFVVTDRVNGMEGTHQGATDKSGRTAYGKSIGCGAVGKANVFHADGVVQASVDAKQHTWRLHGFRKYAMHGVAISELEPESDATRPATDTARQIGNQGMFSIHDHASLLKLAFYASTCSGVAEKEMARVFIINEMGACVGSSLLASRRNGYAIIRLVFNDRYTMRTQFVFFPGTRVGRHVHGGAKSQLGCHDANRKTKVASRSHSYGV